MRLGWLCLGMVSLLGGAGFAGEPVALGGHTLRGAGRLRIDAHGGAAPAAPVQEQAELIVRLGPSGDCIWPLRADELFFSLAGGYSFLLGTGSWGVDGKGRMALALDSHAFEGELRDAYWSACVQGVTPAACSEALDRLETRVVRSELRLKATAERARVRGKVALALVDPVSGEVASTWAASFRDGAGLRVEPPVDYDCGDDDGGIIIIGPRPR
jgi:hypothetical protein